MSLRAKTFAVRFLPMLLLVPQAEDEIWQTNDSTPKVG
jgi:hypothetical protein